MSLLTLAWYLSGVLCLSFLVTLAISYAPPTGGLELILQGGTGAGALTSIVLAVWLSRFPSNHWTRATKPTWTVWIAAAVTLFMAIFVVG